MSSKRTVFLMALLLLLLGVYVAGSIWEQKFPGGYIPPPLSGTNKLTGLTLTRHSDSWLAEFDYFYTGKPFAVQLRARAASRPGSGVGGPPGDPGNLISGSFLSPQRGQHHGRINLPRPTGPGRLRTDRVIAEMIMLGAKPEVLAEQEVAQEIEWPDEDTWLLQQTLQVGENPEPFKSTVPDSDPLTEQILRETVTCSKSELEGRHPCPDFNERSLEAGRTQRRFIAKSYDWLDARYARLCSGKERFTSGIWKLREYESALQDYFLARNLWKEDYETIQEWEKVKPDSGAARLTEAIYWNAYAWRARGQSYSSTVAPESWQLFRQRLEKSRTLLAALIDSDGACPLPYELMIDRLSDLGADEKDLRILYAKATRKFPEYHGLYFAMARHYEPKWGGSLDRYEAFADEAAAATKTFEGIGMYARIYWQVDDAGATPYRAGTSEFPVWSKLKQGYKDLVRLYPSSLKNLRKFADVACRSNDSALYRDLRARTASYEDSRKFFLEPPLDSFEACDLRHHWVHP